MGFSLGLCSLSDYRETGCNVAQRCATWRNGAQRYATVRNGAQRNDVYTENRSNWEMSGEPGNGFLSRSMFVK